MELKQLRLFLRVAEIRNYTIASEQVGLAQSALSRQIKNLEERLGVELFDRSRRRVQLTPAGEMLQLRAQQILDLVEEVSLQVTAGTLTPKGTVSIGAHPSFAGLIFPELAQEVRAAFPMVRLSFRQATTDVLTEQVYSGVVDVAVISYLERSSRLEVTKLCNEKMFLVSPAGESPELGEECELERVLHLPMITTTAQSRERQAIEREAIKYGRHLDSQFESDSHHVMLKLVSRGLGRCILPQSALLQEPGQQAWTSTCISDITIERFLARRADRPMSPAVAGVVELLRAIVEKHF